MANKKKKKKDISVLRTDGTYFPQKILGVDLWPKQTEILESVLINERTTVKSCHASGKTFVSAITVLNILYAYPSAVVITTAPTFKQVEKVIWGEIHKLWNNGVVELPGTLNQTELMVDRKHKWFAVGMVAKTSEDFQGLRSDTMTFILVDEASGVDTEIFDGIYGILSTGNVRLLLIGNPTDPTGAFADSFKSTEFDRLTISAFDTPNFAPFKTIDDVMNSTREERDNAVKFPFLITPNWVYTTVKEYGIDHPYVQSRVLGDFPDVSDDHLIPLSAVEYATRNNDVSTDGERALGVDVARMGSDSTEMYGRQGQYIFLHEEEKKRDTMEISSKSRFLYLKEKFDIIAVDDIGLGGGVTDRLKEFGDINVHPVNAAGAPKNKKLYINLRAEMYWELRDAFIKREIRIPDDPDLVKELTSIKYTYKNGKLKIESKEEIKKRLGKSPDKADALAICWHTSKTSKNAFLAFAEEVEEVKPSFEDLINMK